MVAHLYNKYDIVIGPVADDVGRRIEGDANNRLFF